jgi:hypothetical protein
MEQNEKLINEIKRHTEILGNVETATNIISEGPFSARGVYATLCCSSIQLGYWQSTNPLPAVITAANGNRGAKYINHNKMTINGNTPQVGDYFRAVESEGGSPTGDHPNGESSGLIYRVTAVTPWDLGTTYNFPAANGCPSCPGISSWGCNVSGGGGFCTEVPGNNAPYATYADCPCKEPDTYDCEQNGITSNCVPVQGAGGQFATIGACQAACEVKSRKICAKICANRVYAQYYRQELCQETQSSTINGQVPQVGDVFKELGLINIGGGSFTVAPWKVAWRVTQVLEETTNPIKMYQEVEDCSWNEEPVRWACKDYGKITKAPQDMDMKAKALGEGLLTEKPGPVLTGKKCVKDPMGPYATQQQCQDDCYNERFECDGQGNCVGGQTGQYSSLAQCQANCTPPTNTYDCSGAPNWNCNAVSGPGGQYATLAACQTDCVEPANPCIAVLSAWNWWQQIQTNGPKPCNNICNQIENVINDVNPSVADTCMMDYAVSQAQAGGCTCNAPASFQTAKTNHFNNHGCCGENSPNQNPPGPYGCTPPLTLKPNSVCGWSNTQCQGGGSWLKQTKCAWLTANILVPNNCQC